MVAASDHSLACIGRPTAYPTATHDNSISITYSGALRHGTVPLSVQFPTGFTGLCGAAFVIRTSPIVQSLPHSQIPGAVLNYGFSHTFYFTGDSWIADIYGGPGQTVDLNIPFIIPANQINKPAGTYAIQFNTRLINRNNGAIFHESYINLAATVASSCTLPPPSLSALDFTEAIINGKIPAAFQRTFSLSNAGCNGPARLSLAALPMIRSGGGAPIHFSASAVLGGTNVVLDTQIASASSVSNITAPEYGSVPVTVTVLPTAVPLAAGTYSSILRVSLEPAQ